MPNNLPGPVAPCIVLVFECVRIALAALKGLFVAVLIVAAGRSLPKVISDVVRLFLHAAFFVIYERHTDGEIRADGFTNLRDYGFGKWTRSGRQGERRNALLMGFQDAPPVIAHVENPRELAPVRIFKRVSIGIPSGVKTVSADAAPPVKKHASLSPCIDHVSTVETLLSSIRLPSDRVLDLGLPSNRGYQSPIAIEL